MIATQNSRSSLTWQADEDGACTCRGCAVSVTQVPLMASPLSTICKAMAKGHQPYIEQWNHLQAG